MFYKKPCKVFLALFESADKIICGVTIQITATKKYFTVFVGIIIPCNCIFFFRARLLLSFLHITVLRIQLTAAMNADFSACVCSALN